MTKTPAAPTTGKAACLVTGCAGFVGSWLASGLLQQGVPVVGVDNFLSGRPENMTAFRHDPLFTFHERSVLEPGLLESLLAMHPGLDRVFHLAALVSVPYSIEHPAETMALNHAAALTLHDDARRLGLGDFVFAGSAAEYGTASRLPLTEDAADGARRLSPYSESKYLVSKAIEASGFGVSLRFFNIYGPRQDPSSPYSGVMAKCIDAALDGRPFTIFGDGLQTRDFIAVQDAVQAYLLAAGLTGPRKRLRGIYNVGTQRPVSVETLARQVAEATARPYQVTYQPERPGDIRHSLADTSKLRQASGFHPAIELAQGVALTVAWHAAERRRDHESAAGA